MSSDSNPSSTDSSGPDVRYGGGREEDDKPYDEAIDVGSDENVSTPTSSEPDGGARGFPRAASPDQGYQQQLGIRPAAPDSSDETSSDSDSDTGGMAGQYDPGEYSNLTVSPEVAELFQYIGRYKPTTVELETSLKPFVPEYIPAVGEVDGFIKLPRPDGKQSLLGVTQIDEPCLNPSDPTVLDLQLRSMTKASVQPMEVRSIENAERTPKEIANWVARIADLHRVKPPPVVQYSKRMPDIDALMQVWPQEFDQFLSSNPLPTADLDIPLADYVKLVSVLLDVPVQRDYTEALHVIFTLYLEFKNNPLFAREGEDVAPPNVTPAGSEV